MYYRSAHRSLEPVVARNSGSNPSRVVCCHRGCAYTLIIRAVQRSGKCSAVYGNMHYKVALRSFENSRA